MTTKYTDLTGQTFGRLTVAHREQEQKKGNLAWTCSCSCGNEISVRTHHLIHGHTTSCGCHKKDQVKAQWIGKVFSRLTVVGLVEGGYHSRMWVCRCACGQETLASTTQLRAGSKKSCGCQKSESSRQMLIKHGRSSDPIHRIWRSMISRCTYKTDTNWKFYGGRGIRVCERWQSFTNFLADMGERPDRMTLERIDSNGPYSPENCRWATRAEQMQNTRRNRKLTFGGKTMCLSEWARLINIPVTTLVNRLKKGTPLERALRAVMPPRTRKE